MKKLITALAVIALFIAAALTTLAVIYRYENYQTEQKLNKEAAEAKTKREAMLRNLKAESRDKAFRDEYNKLYEQCKQGEVAYNELGTYAQTQVEAPTCGEAKTSAN